MSGVGSFSAYKARINRRFIAYVVCLGGFLVVMALAERLGLSRTWLGASFLGVSLAMYSIIGIYCRTTLPKEYYVAGQRIPAFYNGLATAADWMSAASFISMAGGLYLQGFSGTATQTGGLAYVLGWTGGFCLLALVVAPYLRQLDLYTVPDFFAWRFASRGPRLTAAFAAILCSFVYVVAQIYGVGLIAARITGVRFEMGVLLGLSGVLVCSFLGGMRAVTWTQVAQCVVLIAAFMVPVSWLAWKQLGNPLAPLVYGQQLDKITELENKLVKAPAELEVRAIFSARAREYEKRLADVDSALLRERQLATEKLRRLKQERADTSVVYAAAHELGNLPKDAASAREVWTLARNENMERSRPLGGMPPHAKAFAGEPDGTQAERTLFDESRRNFLALMFCLMVGTVGLPHLLTRFFTTSSVRETRNSVGWSLFFICLLYVSAPALAVLVKFEVLSNLVGHRYDGLPAWITQWAKVDPTLISVGDVNGDGILQLAELHLGADIVMLATPEIGGLPYFVTALVAAGGLAAALSTADGLLLTIGNAFARDVFSRDVQPGASPVRLVILSKFVVLTAALAAAFVAAQRPADILNLVAASFSLAGAALVPVMVTGIFSRRLGGAGATIAMLGGLAVTVYYMASRSPAVCAWFGQAAQTQLWWGIQPVASGVFGVPMGFALALASAALWPEAEPSREPTRAAPA